MIWSDEGYGQKGVEDLEASTVLSGSKVEAQSRYVLEDEWRGDSGELTD